MHINFQERPWDLFGVMGYAITVGVLVLVLGAGTFVAILLVLFVPGYISSASIFPDAKEIDWLERILLSMGLSVAIVPAITLVLNFAPGGINLISVVLSILLFSILTAVIAYRRRIELPIKERLAASIEISMPSWSEYSTIDKLTTFGLGLGLVVASGILASELTRNSAPPSTEFYLTNSTGGAIDFPLKLN